MTTTSSFIREKEREHDMSDPIGTIRYNPTGDYFIRKVADEEWAVYFRGSHNEDEDDPQENMPDYEVAPELEHLVGTAFTPDRRRGVGMSTRPNPAVSQQDRDTIEDRLPAIGEPVDEPKLPHHIEREAS